MNENIKMSYENYGRLEEHFKIMHINLQSPMFAEYGDIINNYKVQSNQLFHQTQVPMNNESHENEQAQLTEAMNALISRTKYPFVQEKNQRLYGPPPNWTGETPTRGCEVFIGHIPRNCFENELVPVFERIGKIYQFRLMIKSEDINKGYGFCVYTNKEDAKRAVTELNNYEIRQGKNIGVCFSVDNCRLFVGGIPKNKTREEILEQMMNITEFVKDVISYPSINDKTKNRGFAFVEYTSHKTAAIARRKLHHQQPKLWGQSIHVDWAEPEREVNEDTMSKVKILFVRNLMVDTTEEELKQIFIAHSGGDPSAVERVKKMSDFAFVHFQEREKAEKCLRELNNTTICGSTVEITWAKPADKNHQQNVKIAKTYTQNEMFITDLNGYIPTFQAQSPGLNFSPTNPLNTNMLAAPHLLNSATQFIHPNGLNFGFTGQNSNRPGKRNAAGSRSVGAQRDRKHPIQKLQKTQINPLANFELLEEFSKVKNFGTPVYTSIPCDYKDQEQKTVRSYYGNVQFPLKNLSFFTPTLYATQEEAKNAAASIALMDLMTSVNFQSVPYQYSDVYSNVPMGFGYYDTSSFIAPYFGQPGLRCASLPGTQNPLTLGNTLANGSQVQSQQNTSPILTSDQITTQSSMQPCSSQLTSLQSSQLLQHASASVGLNGQTTNSIPFEYLSLFAMSPEQIMQSTSSAQVSLQEQYLLHQQQASAAIFNTPNGDLIKMHKPQLNQDFFHPSAASSTTSLSEI